MKLPKNKTFNLLISPISIFLSLSVISIVFLLYVAYSLTSSRQVQNIDDYVVQNENYQTVQVIAKNGFTPEKVSLLAEKETILKLVTKNTIDCSNTLIVRQLNIRKELPINGEVEIRIPAQNSGTKIIATCGMGHYYLELNFI